MVAGFSRSRHHYRLLGLHGSIGPDGEPLVDVHPWDSPEALALVRAVAGDDAELVRSPGIVRVGDPVRLVRP